MGPWMMILALALAGDDPANRDLTGFFGRQASGTATVMRLPVEIKQPEAWTRLAKGRDASEKPEESFQSRARDGVFYFYEGKLITDDDFIFEKDDSYPPSQRHLWIKHKSGKPLLGVVVSLKAFPGFMTGKLGLRGDLIQIEDGSLSSSTTEKNGVELALLAKSVVHAESGKRPLDGRPIVTEVSVYRYTEMKKQKPTRAPALVTFGEMEHALGSHVRTYTVPKQSYVSSKDEGAWPMEREALQFGRIFESVRRAEESNLAASPETLPKTQPNNPGDAGRAR